MTPEEEVASRRASVAAAREAHCTAQKRTLEKSREHDSTRRLEMEAAEDLAKREEELAKAERIVAIAMLPDTWTPCLHDDTPSERVSSSPQTPKARKTPVPDRSIAPPPPTPGTLNAKVYWVIQKGPKQGLTTAEVVRRLPKEKAGSIRGVLSRFAKDTAAGPKRWDKDGKRYRRLGGSA